VSGKLLSAGRVVRRWGADVETKAAEVDATKEVNKVKFGLIREGEGREKRRRLVRLLF
jgi:hypothetical protein